MDFFDLEFSTRFITDSKEVPEESYFKLHMAIGKKCYPSIYKLLRGYPHTFSPEAAFALLNRALDNGLTTRVFKAILKNAPPVPEILSAGKVRDFFLGVFGLMERAAYEDRCDVMSLLLAGGASLNRTPGCDLSPLEAALRSNALSSVDFLVEQPELDTAWTPNLLAEWARRNNADSQSDADFLHELCLAAIAGRFIGGDGIYTRPLPIPEAMTLPIIVKAGNWTMLERFCRERGSIPKEEGLGVIPLLQFELPVWEKKDQSAIAGVLASILEACPGLLRKEKTCQALLRCFLGFEEDVKACLRPWVKRLGGRRIAMDQDDWIYWNYDGLLDVWQKLLPQGPVLVIKRWSVIFDGFQCNLEEEDRNPAKALGRILSACPIRGGGRKGKLSPVAQTVLCCGDVSLIKSLFAQPHDLLATEDPDRLIAYVQDADCPRSNRAAVLAYVQKKVEYDL